MAFETISVVGLGYIGLPTAAVFASRRIKVIGLDVDPHVVDTINKGDIHIVEPELDIVVHAAVHQGYLRATLRPEPADAFMIAVPTPFKDEHEPDLKYIEAASKAIAPVLKKGDLVVLESTSPVGATEKMSEWMAELRPDITFPQTHGEQSDIRIAHCPERVLPGHVIRELIENDRVIGGMTKKCSDAAVALYKIIVEGECVITNTRTAEMAKLTENSFRDVNIAFANELSIICDKLDIDVWELIQLSNRHPRVNILQPGCGVGGHCIAVDPWFIVSNTPDEARLISTAREVNDSKPQWVVDKVHEAVGKFLNANRDKSIKDIKIACLGLAFKPNIDDLRESPALAVSLALAEAFPSQVVAVEPNLENSSDALFRENLPLVSLNDAKNADIQVVLVAHTQFKNEKLNIVHHPYLIDICGLFK